MDMSSMTEMAMSSMASATSPSPAAASTSMSSMDMSSSSPMSMMTMTFFSSVSTPLYSTAWTPSSTGQYAGTCIFLIILALILRCLLALKGVLEMHVWQSPVLAGHTHHGGAAKNRSFGSVDVKGEEGLMRKVRMQARPWRLKVDGPRALLDLAMVGVGYLLMLAVMTYNVGYFLSVLAGTFLGSLLLGRFAVMSGNGC